MVIEIAVGIVFIAGIGLLAYKESKAKVVTEAEAVAADAKQDVAVVEADVKKL